MIARLTASALLSSCIRVVPLVLATTLAATACARIGDPPVQTVTPAAAPAASAAPAIPMELHWFRNSAEYRALTLSVYRSAAARAAELARGLAAGSWAVILDVDETSLDNSEYQRRLAFAGQRLTDSTWYAWIRESAAPAVPGAVEFTRTIAQLGGRVVLVSNRDDVVCDATRANLRARDVTHDLVLCRVNKLSDKGPRFGAVEEGTAGLPPLRIIMWIGDNVHDFPGLTQAVRATPGALDLFGSRYFMLPNPLYGSWESNPRN